MSPVFLITSKLVGMDLLLRIRVAGIQEQQREDHAADHDPEIHCIAPLDHAQQRTGQAQPIGNIQQFCPHRLQDTDARQSAKGF